MTDVPTKAEIDAAHERYQRALEKMDAAHAAVKMASEEYFAASDEHQKLRALAVPLRDFVLSFLRRYQPGVSAKSLAARSYRDIAEVNDCLGGLLAEELIVRHGRGYTAAGGAS